MKRLLISGSVLLVLGALAIGLLIPGGTAFGALITNVFPPDGDVGIGTSMPSDKLDVQIGETDLGGVTVSDPNNKVAFLGDLHGGQEIGELALYHAGQKTVRLVADAGESYISSGKVGIGTQNPQSALHVDGYVQLDLTSGAPSSSASC